MSEAQREGLQKANAGRQQHEEAWSARAAESARAVNRAKAGSTDDAVLRVLRRGPGSTVLVARRALLSENGCRKALNRLLAAGRVSVVRGAWQEPDVWSVVEEPSDGS